MSRCHRGHLNLESSRFCTLCGELLTPLQPTEKKTLAQVSQPVGTTQNQEPASRPMVPKSIVTPTSNVGNLPPVSDHGSPNHCSRCGTSFGARHLECQKCRTLRPLGNGHRVSPELFQWSLDGLAMAKLRSIKSLVAVAQSVSQHAGKPWIEANFNGIRLGYNQMPQVYLAAVQAARLLGIQKMPVIYVSGARPWDALTFGTDHDAFIVMGSALVSCFQRSELMFLFAREMGHILAGHALWKTVIQFMVGEQSASSGMMRNGIAGLLDPSKLIEGAIELPLIAWARQAEITADRAGLLVSSGLTEVRKVLMIWALKSPVLYRQINLDAWMEQQEADAADGNIRLAESVSSSTNYLTRRLKLMQEYDRSPLVHQFRQYCMATFKNQARRKGTPEQITATNTPPKPDASTPKENVSNNFARNKAFMCPKCNRKVYLPQDRQSKETSSQALDQSIVIRCPHAGCDSVSRVRSKNTMLNLNS